MVASHAIDPGVAHRLDKLAADGSQPVSWDEVRDVVERVLSIPDGDSTGNDPKLYSEIQSLARYIQETKAEVASLRPERISHQQFPAAADELDAVVTATEEATNAIMGAAELIESTGEAIGGDHAAALSDAVSRIYEACSFQDITGQRVGKVVRALKAVEAKVEEVLLAFDKDDSEVGDRRAKREVEMAKPDVNTEQSLLNGPAHPAEANNQDDIDALLASLD